MSRGSEPKPLRVLLVEDSPTQACEIAAELEAAGCEVLQAEDGKEALRLLQSEHVDAVVSDVVMPRIGGYELCRRIRRGKRTRDLPVILLTALEDPADIVDGFEAGADGYVIKTDDARSRAKHVLRALENARDRDGRGIRIAAGGREVTVRSDDPRVAGYFAATFAELAEAQHREARSRREGESLRRTLLLTQGALDALDSAVAVLDGQGSLLLANAAWFHLNEMLRAPGNDPGPLLAPVVARVLSGPEPAVEEELAAREPDEERWFRVRVARLPGETRARVVVSCADVSALRKVAEIEREERFVDAALAEAAREFMRAATLQDVLACLRGLTSATPGVLGVRTALFADGSRAGAPQCSATRMRRRLSRGRALERAVAGGGGRRLRRLYLPLFVGDEAAGYSAVDFADRGALTPSRRRLLEGLARLASSAMERARLMEELERANRVKTEFVNTMSHELRTPLHVILGYGELLLDGTFGTLSPEQLDVLRQMDRNARMLADLVNATLDLSRLERDRLPVRVVEGDLRTLLEDLRAELWQAAAKPHLRYTWRVPEEPVPLRTDLGKLKIVLRNLISNAIKFTDGGAVTVSARARGPELEVRISDTGIGIPPEHHETIFECFRQLDGSITRRHEGVGLGLYIARRLTEMLGGRITLRSKPGRGSVFTVRVPRRFGQSNAEDGAGPVSDAAQATAA